MPNRQTGSAYRFGYNGKEMDNEINGEGNSLDFGARIIDARLGRWMSCDIHQGKTPGISAYNFSFNNPLAFNDPDGKDGRIKVQGNAITMETTVFLYGPDASEQIAQKYNDAFAKMDNCANTVVDGKSYIVTINVKYVYSKVLTDTREAIMKTDTRRPEQGDALRIEDIIAKDFPNDPNFSSGDNMMLIDVNNDFARNATGASGNTYQGFGSNTSALYGNGVRKELNTSEANFGKIRIIPSVATFDDAIEETFHMFGFDERYNNKEDSPPNTGFDNDVTSGNNKNSRMRPVSIHPIHFQDVVKNVLLPANLNKSSYTLSSTALDNTEMGRKPTLDGDVQNAVKNTTVNRCDK